MGLFNALDVVNLFRGGGGGGEFQSMAEEMCGNEGQIAIISDMDMESIYRDGAENEGEFDLEGECSHPEAVEEILAEVEAAMEDKYAQDQATGAADESTLETILDAIGFDFDGQ